MHFNSLKSSKWAFAAGMALGVLIALPLAAPLFDGKILEPVATMWGSALGAAAAVAGAFWVADRQSLLQRRNAAALVYAMFVPISTHMQGLRDAYGAPSRPHPLVDDDDDSDMLDPEDWTKIGYECDQILEDFAKLNQKIHRIDAALHALGPAEMQVVFDLEAAIADAVNNAVEPLQKESVRAGRRMFSAPVSWSGRNAVEKFTQRIVRAMRKLERAAT